jgi:hypothetical protein
VSPPTDPRAHRFAPLSRALSAAVGVAGVLVLGALLLPERFGQVLGGALLAVLIATPLLRVAWFVQRWFRRGDPRFALVGLGVLAVVATGAALAVL